MDWLKILSFETSNWCELASGLHFVQVAFNWSRFCASVPLIGTSFKNLPPNWHNFVILPLIGARFEIVTLFLIGTRFALHTCLFVILLLIGAAE